MNVLYLTLSDFDENKTSGVHIDLVNKIIEEGHRVYVISPVERRKKIETYLIVRDNLEILKLKIGNTQKTNVIEKGISTITLEGKYVAGIKKYFDKVRFDIVLYTTPPITLEKAITYVKQRDQAKTYLILKDIFPQNAVDLGMLHKTGVMSPLYQYFRRKERRLYRLSDYIGCMSQANVDYIKRNNPDISSLRLEICPNCILPVKITKDEDMITAIKSKYNIPLDKTIFIYGGNLGKPQGIDFLMECLLANELNDRAYFVIAGSGTEYRRLRDFLDQKKLPNVQLFSLLPQKDYHTLVNSCDVGLIFLDHRFTIPNFPSRILSYMQASMPVLAATDCSTDIGKVIEEGRFGLWCESRDVNAFNQMLNQLCDEEVRKQMGSNARKYLEKYYTVDQAYNIIFEKFQQPLKASAIS